MSQCSVFRAYIVGGRLFRVFDNRQPLLFRTLRPIASALSYVGDIILRFDECHANFLQKNCTLSILLDIMSQIPLDVESQTNE